MLSKNISSLLQNAQYYALLLLCLLVPWSLAGMQIALGLFSVISILPWSSEASGNFGKIKADLERRGKMIDDFDIAISAIALSHKCGVITANLIHFQRIKNLESINWKET